MLHWPRRPSVDPPARERTAALITSLLEGTVEWDAVPAALGKYSGQDRGVQVIHRELRAIAFDTTPAPSPVSEDEELTDVLHRTRWFLRSETPYRWNERGPVEIIGAYLGIAALAWMAVAGAGAIWGFDHEAVIAAALLATLLLVVMATAMAVALFRRMWWRYIAGREGADHRAWPFFTSAEYSAAREAVSDASP